MKVMMIHIGPNSVYKKTPLVESMFGHSLAPPVEQYSVAIQIAVAIVQDFCSRKLENLQQQ